MTTTPNRSSFLTLLLPAVVVLVGYSWTWNSSQNRALQAQQTRLDKAKASAVTKAHIAEQQSKLTALRREIEQSQRGLTELRSQLEQQVALWGGRDSTDTVEKLMEVLRANQLHIDEAGLATESGDSRAGDGKVVPALLKEAVDRQKTRAGFRPPTLFRVRFAAKYASVADTLKTLSDQKLALPLRLDMDEVDPETDWRMWTLFVWL